MRVLLMIALVLVPAVNAGAQTDERTVYATVVDRNEALVPNLSAGEFIVREDGIAREVLRSSEAIEPAQIALLIDTSQAIDNHVLDIRTALRAFFKQMGGRHEVSVIGLGERPTVLVDFTKDPGRLEKTVGSVFARTGSGTYVLDGIVEAAAALRKRKAARPHIIVYTARGPEFSERHHSSVIDALRESGATLHSLPLNKSTLSVGSREEQELELALSTGSEMSGGDRTDILTTMSLADRLQGVGNLIDRQYAVTYARPRKLIPPKTLEVTVKKPDLTVRARRWP